MNWILPFSCAVTGGSSHTIVTEMSLPLEEAFVLAKVSFNQGKRMVGFSSVGIFIQGLIRSENSKSHNLIFIHDARMRWHSLSP